MPESKFFFLIVGMGVVTYLPRWFPLIFLTRRKLPEQLIEWLDLIPVAILSALVVPALITSGEPRNLEFMRPEILVSVPTFIIALKTKSLAGTVIAGMFLFWLAGFF